MLKKYSFTSDGADFFNICLNNPQLRLLFILNKLFLLYFVKETFYKQICTQSLKIHPNFTFFVLKASVTKIACFLFWFISLKLAWLFLEQADWQIL